MKLVTAEEAQALVKAGRPLMVAGEEAVLGQLPRGKWIGGTIPYFMTADGGVQDRQRIFVHVMPEAVIRSHVRTYDATTISKVNTHGYDNGMSAIIIPALTPLHQEFAKGAPQYPGFARLPLFGWISGVHVSEIGKTKPKVFDGELGRVLDADAVVLHMELAPTHYVNVDTVNLFRPGTGDQLTFPTSSFSVDKVLVNGKETSFFDYVTERKIDLKLPLVADYCGAMINVSFQALNVETHRVDLYAPVFENVVYRVAEPVADYVKAFDQLLKGRKAGNTAFSCNCILNYLYAELEGKRTAPFTGPITFGEIAFQLLNQTLVYVNVEKF